VKQVRKTRPCSALTGRVQTAIIMEGEEAQERMAARWRHTRAVESATATHLPCQWEPIVGTRRSCHELAARLQQMRELRCLTPIIFVRQKSDIEFVTFFVC